MDLYLFVNFSEEFANISHCLMMYILMSNINAAGYLSYVGNKNMSRKVYDIYTYITLEIFICATLASSLLFHWVVKVKVY